MILDFYKTITHSDPLNMVSTEEADDISLVNRIISHTSRQLSLQPVFLIAPPPTSPSSQQTHIY